jgi:hypothetical protein
MPRRKDIPILEFVMGKGASKEELLSISRVRGLLREISVSKISTRGGTQLE